MKHIIEYWLLPVIIIDRQERKNIASYSWHDSQRGLKTGQKSVFQYLIKPITRMKKLFRNDDLLYY